MYEGILGPHLLHKLVRNINQLSHDNLSRYKLSRDNFVI